jgi:hypothetical protein
LIQENENESAGTQHLKECVAFAAIAMEVRRPDFGERAPGRDIVK